MSISRLMLGTAKFGLENYPPGSGRPKPSRQDAIALIRYAYDRGIRAFDTAWAYRGGDVCAEDILAEALDGRPAHVTTKRPVDGFTKHPHWITLLHNPLSDQMRPEADGASVYTPEEAYAALRAGYRHLQVPYWLMDSSQRQAIYYARLTGVTLYARQPYGRGQVPCKEALWFALASPADYIVFGAANQEQLDQTLAWAELPRPQSLLPSVCTRG